MAANHSFSSVAGALVAFLLVLAPLTFFFGWLIRRAWRGEPIGVRAAPVYLLVQLIKATYEVLTKRRRR